MNKTTIILILFMLLCSGIKAQTTITTYGRNYGIFYNASGTKVTEGGFNAKRFVSNTIPAVTIEASVNATALNCSDASDTRIGFNNGTETITISVPAGYVITSYQFDCRNVKTDHPAKTLTTESRTTINIPAGENATWYSVNETGINKQSTHFTVETTGWSPIYTRNFKVTFEEKYKNGYYRLRSHSYGTNNYGYMGLNGTGVYGNILNPEKDPSTIFHITRDNASPDTNGPKYRIMVQDSYPRAVWLNEECSVTTLLPGENKRIIAVSEDEAVIRTSTSGANNYLNVNSSSYKVVGYNNSGDNSKWTIEPATSIEVDLNDGGDGFHYATRYFDFPVSADDGLYILTSNDGGNVVTAQKVTEVPAKTGFLIRSASSSITLTIPTTEPSGVTSLLSGNCLATTTLPSGTIYVFSKVDDELGFFEYTGSDLPANRAYIVDEVGSTRSFILNFNDEMTGINASLNMRQPSQAYDLQGRRISIGNAKGLYIQNGKKILK